MRTLVAKIRQNIAPPVPAVIRDEFTLLTASQLQSQARLLFLALFITVPTVLFAASEGAADWVRVGLPAVMGTACLCGFLSLLRDLRLSTSVRRARRHIAESTWVSSAMAVVCSVWCVASWLGAPEGARAYYPLILSMGSLATAYCLSSIRLGAVLNLGIGLLPISALLLLSGNRMDVAAGTSLLVAALFQLRMIIQKHAQLVDMLLLQRQMRELADTDPLTGLVNRRAFDQRLRAMANDAGGTGFTLALLDLDDFKPINDRFGHMIGDLVLCEVARRLRGAYGSDDVVARLGGDEFAVIMPAGSAIAATGAANHLLAALVPPCTIDGHSIRIGASVGIAAWPGDGATTDALIETADRALYAAKAGEQPKPAADTGTAIPSAA